MNFKTEFAAENTLAQKAHLFGLVNSYAQALDSQRIFCTHINIAFIGTDGITADCHTFKHFMRVAFKHTAVHKSTGVALVGVADNIFFIVYGISGKLPFHTGGETAAAASAQAGFFNFVNNLLRSHGGNGFGKRLIAAYRNIFFYLFRVNGAAVFKHQAFLLFIKINFRIGRNLFMRKRFMV